MICLRQIFRMIPSAIIKRHPYESQRATISLFQKIFRKRTIRVPLHFNVKDYKVIYSFQLVSVFCSFSRQKYLLYGLSFSMVFGSIGCRYHGYVDDTECYFFTSVGIFNLVVLILITGLARNVVGRIYVNKDLSKVILSYGNTSGKRVNKTFNPVNLVIEDHPNLIYRRICKRLTVKETQFYCNLCNFQAVKDELQFYTLFPKCM